MKQDARKAYTGKKRLRSSSAPAVLKSPTKKKRKQWSNESMLAALEAAKKGLPARKAAKQYGVPRSTLKIVFGAEWFMERILVLSHT